MDDDISSIVSGIFAEDSESVAPSAPMVEQAAPVDPLDALISQAYRNAPEPMTTGEKITTGVLTTGNAALLGFGDEIGAAGAAVIDEGKQLFGLAPERSIGDSYEHYRDTAREKMGQFRDENPGTALGLELAGGFATGGVGAAKTGVLKAPSMVSSIGRGVATGAGYGAVAGAGYADGDLDARLEGATMGAGVGGVLGGAVGGVSGLVNKVGTKRAAQQLRKEFGQAMNSELGALIPKGATPKAKQQVTAAQKVLLKIFDDATDEELLLAGQRIEKARATNTPLTIVEALDTPQGWADAKAIRATRGGRGVAGRFMEDRRQSLGQRVSDVLDTIAPEQSPHQASKNLTGAAEDIVGSLESARKSMSGPLYKKAAAENPIIDSPVIDEILEYPMISKAVKRIRSKYPRSIDPDMPDNHFVVLDKLKQNLDDDIGELMRKGRKGEASELLQMKRQITDTIDSMGGYEEARNMYAATSRPIDWLKGSKFAGKKEAGLLEDILSGDAKKSGAAAKSLMGKSPDELRQIRQVYEKSGYGQEFRAGIRAALQEQLDNVNTGVNNDQGGAVFNRLFGRNASEKKMRAILGEDEANKLFTKLDLEGRIQKGEKIIGLDEKSFGSPSTPTAKTMGEHKGIIGKVMDKGVKGTLKEAFESLKPGEHEELTKQIAKKLFSEADPKEFAKLSKLQTEYNKWVRGVDTATETARQGGQTSAGSKAGQLVSDDEAGKASIGLAGGVGAGGMTAASFGAYLDEKYGAPAEAPEVAEGDEEEALTQTNILWKPQSDNDGNLVVLFPYEAGSVTIKDAETGKVLATGSSTGASNGYADTVRFPKPGRSFKDVIVEDGKGNVLYVDDGARRDENLQSKEVIKSSGALARRRKSERPGFMSRTSSDENSGALRGRERGPVVKTSSKGLDLIKEHEGKRLSAYDDGAGIQTIGYGHTGSGVKKGRITEKEADALLREDVKTAEDAVNRLVDIDLNQNQYDALVSLVFNIGQGAFADSTLLRKLNEGDFEGAAGEFSKWRRAGGRVMKGLVKRREREAELFRV